MESFWYTNPNVLLNKKNYHLFFPTNNMDLNSKLNCITRLSLYLSVILFIYSGQLSYMYIFILTLIVTYLIFKGNNNIET